jgi:hypothetical protein
MKYEDLIEKSNSLTEWEKFEVYMDYRIRIAALKHDFIVVKNIKPGQKGLGYPDKEFLGLNFYFLWKDLKIQDFESFFSVERPEIYRFITNWIEQHSGAVYDTIQKKLDIC